MKSLRKRWLEKVQFPANEDDPNACWLWVGAVEGVTGYGRIWHNGSMLKAHRVGYELVFGPIPDDMMGLHRCNNKRCVRPSHVYLGTHIDNMRDRDVLDACSDKRGSNAKLTWSKVRAIRTAITGGASRRSLQVQYGVGETTVRDIVHNKTWREDEAATSVSVGDGR